MTDSSDDLIKRLLKGGPYAGRWDKEAAARIKELEAQYAVMFGHMTGAGEEIIALKATLLSQIGETALAEVKVEELEAGLVEAGAKIVELEAKARGIYEDAAGESI